MAGRRHIFRRGPSSLRLLIGVSLVAIALIVLSTYTNYLQPVRAFFLDLVAPFYDVTDVGNTASDWAEDNFASREDLLQENRRLIDENLILQRRVMTMAAVQAENARLRQLLGATEFLQESVLIAELVGTPPNTETHRLIIDRGAEDGLSEGQPVLDSAGIIGQIVTVGSENSEVLMISDRAHALPVEIVRTGSRAIAEGVGDYEIVKLRNIPPTVDILAGDEIISSGLGGSFPHGYPVGVVASVEQNSSTPFLEIEVDLHARLQSSRQMLVLFSRTKDIRAESSEEGVASDAGADEPSGKELNDVEASD